MSGRDYYQILGVARNASTDELRKSYKRLAMKYHPDRNKEPGAEKTFKEVQQAYAVLSDQEKRSMYDRFGTVDESAFAGNYAAGGGFSDIFDSIFGNFGGTTGYATRKPQSMRGRDIQLEMKLSLEQAASGTARQLRVKTYDSCADCNASGAEAGSSAITCDSCGGSGILEQKVAFMVMQQPCARCRGCGTVIPKPCKTCQGSGRVRKSRTVEVTIPSGIDNDDMLRMRGKGEAGANGAEHGDLLVRISIERHPFFRREGDNLHCTVPISFYAAAAGATLKIPLLGGGGREISVPKGMQSGQAITVRSAGIKGVRSNSPGDLICKVTVETPKNLDANQLSLLRSFEDSLRADNTCSRESWLQKVKSLFS